MPTSLLPPLRASAKKPASVQGSLLRPPAWSGSGLSRPGTLTTQGGLCPAICCAAALSFPSSRTATAACGLSCSWAAKVTTDCPAAAQVATAQCWVMGGLSPWPTTTWCCVCRSTPSCGSDSSRCWLLPPAPAASCLASLPKNPPPPLLLLLLALLLGAVLRVHSRSSTHTRCLGRAGACKNRRNLCAREAGSRLKHAQQSI